mgnify:CR=1 FL=1
MKQYFQNLKSQLQTVGALRTVDAAWGQLNYEQPPVKFPCALIDMNSTSIAQVKPNQTRIHADINITVADIRYNLNPADSFNIFDVVEQVIEALMDWTDGRFTRLTLANISPVTSVPGFCAYVLTFNTIFGIVPPETAAETEPETTDQE